MSAKSKAEHNTAQAARRVHAELKALRALNAELATALETWDDWLRSASNGFPDAKLMDKAVAQSRAALAKAKP